jgi:cobalt-zinc-cadmium efflux system membrane fusion protein
MRTAFKLAIEIAIVTSSETPRSSLFHRRRLAFVLGAAVIVLGLMGVRLWTRSPAAPEETPANHTFQPTTAQLQQLGIAPVQEAAFETEVATEGTLAFDDERVTPVYSPYTGRVMQVTARLGDQVKAGAALYTVAAGELVQGQSDVASAHAVVEVARAAERRQKALFEAGGASEHDAQQATSDRIAAEAAWSAARARLRILGQSDAAIDAMERSPVGQGPETRVAAPIDGVITQRSVAPGQLIQSGANGGNPVFVIANVQSVWVVAWVREGDAAAIRPGQSAQIEVASLPGQAYTGKVQSVSSGLDPNTHRLPVRILVDNRGGELKPEMYAEVRIATSASVHRPAVPDSAIVYDGELTRVFVEANGSIAGRDIRIGRHAGHQVEVLDGLKVGERIVTASTLFVDHAVAGD